MRAWLRVASGGWVGLGHMQEVTGDRQQFAAEDFDRRLAYAQKSETHLWIVTLVHYASDVLLDLYDNPGTGMPMLDVDTLSQPPLVGCYVCEQSYDPRLRRRKCPGDPS